MSLLKQSFLQPTDYVVNLVPVCQSEFNDWFARQDDFCKNWVQTTGFVAKPYSRCFLPDPEGRLLHVYLGVTNLEDIWAFADLANSLPEGKYQFVSLASNFDINNAALGWALGAYTFNRYKAANRAPAQLVLPEEIDDKQLTALIESMYLIRDLINTPSADMGPAELAQSMQVVAQQYSAQFKQLIGKQLQQEYPALYTVGASSQREPRLLELRWGNPQHPKITLVGKGVCFDSGGLDIKTASGMLLMKKDMGGAAHALGLAKLIMAMNLPVSLRVLIGAADNVIAANAYKPGDIITTRKGLTIEVTNTDAEGRLVICDALTAASAEQPDLLLDFTTLTGAARIALGTDVPVFFCNDEKVTQDLNAAAKKAQEPIWQLPLYAPYRELMESPIANMINSSNNGYAGAITAAVFLQEFIDASIPWVHFDLMAWNLPNRPGRPQGGEAMAIRAVWQYLCKRYAL